MINFDWDMSIELHQFWQLNVHDLLWRMAFPNSGKPIGLNFETLWFPCVEQLSKEFGNYVTWKV